MGPLYESDQSAKGVAASATVLLASIEPRHSCPTSSIQRSRSYPVPRIRGRNPATHYNIPVPTSSSPRPLRHSRAHFVIPAQAGIQGRHGVEQSGQLSKTSERDKSEGARFRLLYLDGKGLR